MRNILSNYRKSKQNTTATLSEKVMAITKAGKPAGVSHPMVCILCDTNDVCDPCDAGDWSCSGGDIICITHDSCDMEFPEA
jgi:hypothetical protein